MPSGHQLEYCLWKLRWRPGVAAARLLLPLLVGAACLAVGADTLVSLGQVTAQERENSTAQNRFLDGRDLYREGRYQEAVTAFAEVLEAVPDHPQARLYLQSAQRKLGESAPQEIALTAPETGEVRNAEVAPQAEIVAANDPEAAEQRADAYYKEALALYKKGQYTEAKAKLQRVSALVPDHAKGNELFAKILAAEEEAARQAEEARLRSEQQRQEQETRETERVRKENVAQLLESGKGLAREGRLDEARSSFEQVLALEPDNRAALSELERLRSREAEATKVAQDQAAQATKAALAAEQERAAAEAAQRVAEAGELAKAGRYDEALASLDRAAALDPANRDVERERARIQKDRERAEAEAARASAEATKVAQEQAAQATKAALAAEQERAAADAAQRVAEAGELAKAGRYDEALASLDRAAALDPANRDIERERARIQKDRERAEAESARAAAEATKVAQDQAAQATKAALAAEQEQTSAEVARLIGDADRQLEAGNVDEARNLLTQAQSLDPANREVSRQLSRLDRRAEELAREAQRRQETQQQEEVSQRIAQAELLAAQGRYDEALPLAQAAVDLDPGNRAALRTLEQIQRDAAQAAEAATARAEAPVDVNVEETASTTVASAASDREIEQHIDAGKRHYAAGRYQEALAEFTAVLDVAPDHSTALLYVERIHAALAAAPAEPEVETVPPPVVVPEPVPVPAELPEAVEDGLTAARAAVARGMAYYNAGDLDSAEQEFNLALQADPSNAEAQRQLTQIEADRKASAERSAAETAKRQAAEQAQAGVQASQLFDQGMQKYLEGDVIAAVELWRQALELDPANESAKTNIELTRDEYDRALQEREESQRLSEQERLFLERLRKPDISIELVSTDINEALNILGAITGFNVIAGDGVDGRITANIVEQSLEQVLNMMLNRYGFGWERVGNDIFVRPAHVVKTFQLTEEEYTKLTKILNDANVLQDPSQALQYLLYPETGRSEVTGRLLQLNPQTRTLMVKDSEYNVKIVEQFLSNIPPLVEQAEPLINKHYYVNPETAEKIFNLLKLAVYGDKELTGKDPRGRLLLLDKDTSILIVKDTQENITVIEQIISDQELVERLQRNELVAERVQVTDDLDPLDPANPEAEFRRQQIVQQTLTILEAMLYGRDGRDLAVRQGRQMFPNPERGYIDIVDTPANIKKVQSYMQSVQGGLDQTVTMRRIPIMHADPYYVANFVGQFLLGTGARNARRIHISENFATGTGSRVSSGRGGGSAGGSSFNFQNPTERGGRELSSEPIGVLPREVEGDAFMVIEPNTATLLIMCNDPTILAWIEQMVEFLDIRPRQVEIESRLIQVDLDEARERSGSLGVVFQDGLGSIGDVGDFLDWPGTADFLNNQAGQTTFTLQSVGGKTQVDLIFQFLNTLESTEILNAPKIVSMSAPNFVPTVFISSLEPYISSAEFDDGGDDDPTNNRINIEYDTVDVGVQLSVYPIVTGDDHIYLDVLPRISAITGRLPVVVDFGSSSQVPGALNIGALGVPIIDVRQILNTVVLGDGETVILGGLTRDEFVESIRRTPGLSRVPVLGILFKQKSETVIKQTILIFVTVNIIKD